MKLKRITASIVLTCVAATAFADVTTNTPKTDPMVEKSISNYKVCDVQALATEIGKKFSVVYMPDEAASYNYYIVRNQQEMNADAVRKAVCTYVMDKSCFLYWGNVANMAMFSQQKAAWFPADTSPHYMLSPIITCDKLGKK